MAEPGEGPAARQGTPPPEEPGQAHDGSGHESDWSGQESDRSAPRLDRTHPAPDGAAPPPATGQPGPAAPDGTERRRFRFRRELRWTITALVLIFVFEYLLLPEIASARRSINLLGKVSIGFLVLAVLLELGALLAYAELSRTVLTPEAPRLFRMFRINLSTLAVTHVLPAGTAPGTALGYRLLTDSGVRGSTAAFGLATQGVGSAVVLNGIFWLALLVSVPLEGYNPLYGFAALAGVILLTLFGGVVILLTRGQRAAVERLCRLADHLPFVTPEMVSSAIENIANRLRILLRDRRMLRHALLWAAANWLLDAASLWVFLYAYGSAVFPIDLLVAYGLANILAVLPITPGGLGVVEGVLIPTLVGFGVPKGVAVLGVLTYRLVNFWLPIPTGGAAYLSLRVRSGRRAADRERAAGTSRSPGTNRTAEKPATN